MSLLQSLPGSDWYLEFCTTLIVWNHWLGLVIFTLNLSLLIHNSQTCWVCNERVVAWVSVLHQVLVPFKHILQFNDILLLVGCCRWLSHDGSWLNIEYVSGWRRYLHDLIAMSERTILLSTFRNVLRVSISCFIRLGVQIDVRRCLNICILIKHNWFSLRLCREDCWHARA